MNNEKYLRVSANFIEICNPRRPLSKRAYANIAFTPSTVKRLHRFVQTYSYHGYGYTFSKRFGLQDTYFYV